MDTEKPKEKSKIKENPVNAANELWYFGIASINKETKYTVYLISETRYYHRKTQSHQFDGSAKMSGK